MGFERTQTIHHPMPGILGQPPQHAFPGVHVGIDETRQDDFTLEIDEALGLIVPGDFLAVTDGGDLPAVDGHGMLRPVTDARPFHGQKMRRGDNAIHLFHRFAFPSESGVRVFRARLAYGVPGRDAAAPAPLPKKSVLPALSDEHAARPHRAASLIPYR